MEAKKRLTIGLGLVLGAAVVLFDTGLVSTRFKMLHGVPYADKWLHFTLLGSMAFCVNLSFPSARKRLPILPILRGSAILAVVATLDELSHTMLSTRTFTIGDLLANYAGILLFGRLALLWVSWQDQRPASASV